MAREIERRFLVRDVTILDGRKGDAIVQGYIAKESGSMSVRVRIRAERAYLTLKSPNQGFSRDEFEYAVEGGSANPQAPELDATMPSAVATAGINATH